MKPRWVVALAVVAMVTMPAARPAAAGDAAATVNGVDISVDDFEEALTERGAGETVPGDAGRSVLRELVVGEAVRQFLDVNGLDREDATIEEAAPPDVASVRAAFTENRVSLGVVCVRAIFVADEADQHAAISALVNGEPFSDVGASYSADPNFDATQGTLLGDPEQPCFDLAQLSQLPHEIAERLLTAPPGAVFGIDEPLSVFVIPRSSVVEEPIAALYEGDTPGRYAVSAFVWSADVTINPRYGRWDSATGTIVPLGQE